eukprot:scaffold161820_cov19-Tisochrysis_lutea.AAC.3
MEHMLFQCLHRAMRVRPHKAQIKGADHSTGCHAHVCEVQCSCCPSRPPSKVWTKVAAHRLSCSRCQPRDQA